MPWLCMVCILGWSAMILAGCGGGGAEVRSDFRAVTIGQELIDLQKARDSGAITADEYDKQRKKILERK